MIYLTFGNQSDGVYSSYVTEVCKFLNKQFNIKITIIAFISIRQFWSVRRSRKKLYANSIVLPMFPRFENWKYNILLLSLIWLFVGKSKVIALSPVAANLALMLKKIKLTKYVIYEGEGATAAEWNEYSVVDSAILKKDIWQIEKKAVLESDFRKTVSSKMINYWNDKFGYKENKHVIIPCSLNSVFVKSISNIEKLIQIRKKWGYNQADIIFVYAGSSAGWQSLELADNLFCKLLSNNKNYHLLLLSDDSVKELDVFLKYPDRSRQAWIEYNKVPDVLSFCDYGILIRENSITNKVAAPTKFAEYLSCGLQVIISNNIGDYSEFTIKHKCGILFEPENTRKLNNLQNTSINIKKKMNSLALKYFTKQFFIKQYKQFINLPDF